MDRYLLTVNSRGVPPKSVPSKLNGTFEYFTSPYQPCVSIPFRSFLWQPQLWVSRVLRANGDELPSRYEQRVITWTPHYVMNAAKKEVLEKVPWLAPAAAVLFGTFWFAQDFKRNEDLHHRF